MNKRWVWLLVVLVPGIVLATVLTTLPASLFLGGEHKGLPLERIEGRVWAGQAVLDWPGQAPVALRWRWSGGLTWDWFVEADAIDLHGQWRLNDRSAVNGVEGQVDVQALDIAQWLVVTWPQGVLDVDIDYAHWNRPDRLIATGQVTWQQAGLAGLVNESLGDVVVVLKPSEAEVGHTDIQIRSQSGGAVSVSGDVLTNGDRFEAKITLTPDPARPDVARFFQSLGPNRDGAVVIERSGSLGLFQ